MFAAANLPLLRSGTYAATVGDHFNPLSPGLARLLRTIRQRMHGSRLDG